MLSLIPYITSFGYLGVAIIIFAESGILLGFFLPGDSLLVAVGLLAAKGVLDIWLVVTVVIVAAILGDSVGYITGKKLGPKVFNRDDSLLFKKAHVKKAEAFFAKHGSLAVVLARFTPVIRTFIPIMAGVGNMSYRLFLAYNILGGILWGGGVLMLSYFAGLYIPGFEKNIEYVIIVVVVLSLIPVGLHLYKDWKNK